MIELETVDQCPICRAFVRTPLHAPLRDNVFAAVTGEWQLYRCENCAAAYLSPRPIPEVIGQTYTTYYTHNSPSGHDLNRPPAAPHNQLLRALRNGYLNHHYDLQFAPSLVIGRWLLPLFRRRRDWLDRLLRHLSRPQATARLLDVGCGNGEFLLRMQGFGWEVEGVEPDEKAAMKARSADLVIHNCTLTDAQLSAESFDAITISHVIEHLHNPVAALQQMYDLLKPNGVLWLATPNLEAAGHRIFGRHWLGLDPPRHLTLFTHAALYDSLMAAGFENIETKRMYTARWTFPISQAIADGVSHPMTHPAPTHFHQHLQILIADFLTFLWPTFGEELVLIAHKPPQ